jgi:L-fuconolactonase
VQAAPNLAGTGRLLELTDRHDFIRGVVGWVDLHSPELDRTLDRYADGPKLRRIRMMVQDGADPLYMLRLKFLAGLHRLFERGTPTTC